MKITELQAYRQLAWSFRKKGYSRGKKDNMPIYSWNNVKYIPNNLTPGHYVYAMNYGYIKLKDIPEKYRTREFFLHTLSGADDEIVKYVKEHPKKFDRQFFKDHIATEHYGLAFEFNDFEYMPLEFIDEEMVDCAMFESINMRYTERRGDCEDWFYSVYRRKPEVLTQELYTLGARCFARKQNGKNEFLSITPEKYRTSEFYFALCLNNDTPVMEDIPESVLTTEFLVKLLNDNIENIQCFTNEALEREAVIKEKGPMKFWQAAIMSDGYQISKIPLNDERIKFFLSLYDKNSPEYEYGFKNSYRNYLREKNSMPEIRNDANNLATIMTIVGTCLGMDNDMAISFGNQIMKASTNRNTMLPIHFEQKVPVKYAKKYDKEEYLREIYRKIGIKILQEADNYYYNVILPANISVVQDNYGYCVKDSKGKTLIHYYDRGDFHNRTVIVDQINVVL